MDENKGNDLSILISTHDQNSSLWKPLEKSYELFWSNLNYPLFITSNFKENNPSSFNFLKVGDEKSWSDNILKCLAKIESKYVMFCFDDTFWKKDIDNFEFESLVSECIENNWNYLRLHPSPRSNNAISKKISLIKPGSKYRASVAFAIYKKNILISLLKEDESAWDFEKDGSIRSSEYDNFYHINFELLPYHNLVIKSKLEPFAKKNIQNQGIDLSELELSSMSLFSSLNFNFYKKIYNLKNKIFFMLGIN